MTWWLFEPSSRVECYAPRFYVAAQATHTLTVWALDRAISSPFESTTTTVIYNLLAKVVWVWVGVKVNYLALLAIPICYYPFLRRTDSSANSTSVVAVSIISFSEIGDRIPTTSRVFSSLEYLIQSRCTSSATGSAAMIALKRSDSVIISFFRLPPKRDTSRVGIQRQRLRVQ